MYCLHVNCNSIEIPNDSSQASIILAGVKECEAMQPTIYNRDIMFIDTHQRLWRTIERWCTVLIFRIPCAVYNYEKSVRNTCAMSELENCCMQMEKTVVGKRYCINLEI